MNRHARLPTSLAAICLALFASGHAQAQDWPQWRGANRDAKVTGFKAPATWPKELTQKWKVDIGDGVATPALVGDKLFVFSRQGNDEIVRCLNAATGEEVWKDQYAAEPATGSAASHPGPRASPTVVDGKVIMLGVRNALSCYDLAGKLLWRKEAASGAWPRFFSSSSPLVLNGMCIVQLGGDREGSITAYDLNTGDEKWKWTGDGPAYASPIVTNLNGTKAIVAVTASKLVALGAADGKELWQTAYTQGRYNATTPIAIDSTVIYAGPTSGITAVKLEKEGEELAAKDKKKIADTTLAFNTPVLRGGWLFGISSVNSLFAANAETGEVAWSAPIGEQQPTAPPAGGPPAGGPGRGRGRGMGGGGGYGSVVDAGSVLIALNPAGQLVVFEPNEKEYKEIAKYKVADGDTYAYPVVSGNRIYVKDKDAVTLWALE